MTLSRYLPGPRALCALMILALPLIAEGGPPEFKSTLVSCGQSCLLFATPPFDQTPDGALEPLLKGNVTVNGQAEVSAQVFGATPLATYDVYVAGDAGPVLAGLLTTDASGDGSLSSAPLPQGTYISGVFLLRDSDGDGDIETKIQTGFVITP